MPPKKTTTPMNDDSIKQLIAQGVSDALAEYEANRGNSNGDDSHNSRTGGRRHVPTTHECTYSDFLKCQPLNFKGTERTVSHEAAYGMTCKILKKMMNDKYCPKGEIKKLEIELWNLKVKGSVMASKPKIIQDAIEFAAELMDQKIHTFAERQAENKRKLDNNNQAQQQPPNKQSVAIAYTAGYGERK
ncbi:hypothetical protein Tco_1450805, partial [Tanacetum coccineum]